jgi:hypothetical protein
MGCPPHRITDEGIFPMNAPHPLSVLVVDDLPDADDGQADLLRLHGYRVVGVPLAEGAVPCVATTGSCWSCSPAVGRSETAGGRSRR